MSIFDNWRYNKLRMQIMTLTMYFSLVSFAFASLSFLLYKLIGGDTLYTIVIMFSGFTAISFIVFLLAKYVFKA